MLKTGDILFVKTKGIVGAIIRFVTQSSFSHVAIAISDTHILEVQPGKTATIVNNPYKSFLVGRYKSELTQSQKLRILESVVEIEGRKYDWNIIIATYLRLFRSLISTDSHNNFICTEAVYYSYLSAGIMLVDWQDGAIAPEDLLQSDELVFFNE